MFTHYPTFTTVVVIGCLAVMLLSGCSSQSQVVQVEVTATPQVNVVELVATPTGAAVASPATPVVATATPGQVLTDLDSEKDWIAFTSERDGNAEIYAVSADGRDTLRLTDNPADDMWPAWFPGGMQLAFTSDRNGNLDIYVMDASAANVRQLTHHEANDIWPDCSPDGRRIAFISRRDGNYEIYIINADGTNLYRLTNTSATEDFPAWSPDGSRLVFSRTEGDDGTYIINADGSGERQIGTFEALELAWSPDGTQIIFAADYEGFRGLYIMDEDGGNVRRLSSSYAGENGPTWSFHGSYLAFASWRDGDGEIYALDVQEPLRNLDGRNLRQLIDNGFEEEFPAWRPEVSEVTSARYFRLWEILDELPRFPGMAIIYTHNEFGSIREGEMHPPYMFRGYDAPGEYQAVKDFYTRELAALGWTIQERGSDDIVAQKSGVFATFSPVGLFPDEFLNSTDPGTARFGLTLSYH